MRHDEVIYLLSPETYVDDLKQVRETGRDNKRMIFANEFEINTTEFYAAASKGLKPEIKFEIYSFEYQNESKFEHDEIEYIIIHTQKKGEKIRLTGERVRK